MTSLPRSLDELHDKRVARWIRESTAGQVDRFGPDSQRELQDRAIAQYGLLDTGIAWSVAHSGYRRRDPNGNAVIASTAQWSEMLAGAGKAWDVLLVGYVSRFARDAEILLATRRAIHRAGAAIFFADDRILSSDEDQWEAFAREAVEAEAYSRRLGKRISQGYAAKRRRHADPGGHPPFGFRRAGADHLLEPDPERSGLVRQAFELAAARRTDREVAAETGIPVFTIRGMLRSPLYAGRLRDGSAATWSPVVEPELWQRVQAIRELRSTRDGRPPKRRTYALSMLRCGACGRRLIGDTGRYRHTDVCAAFAAAARPKKRPGRGEHRVVLGASYPAGAYEDAIRAVLARVSLGSERIATAIGDLAAAPAPDGLELARIARERLAATQRYVRDRDAAELERSMAALDVAEQAANERKRETLDRAAAVEYLRNLPTLWDDAPNARRALAEALFERVDAIGLVSVQITPTAQALESGLAEAFQARTHVYGRGERSGAQANRLILRLVPGIETRVRIRLSKPAPLRLVRSA